MSLFENFFGSKGEWRSPQTFYAHECKKGRWQLLDQDGRTETLEQLKERGINDSPVWSKFRELTLESDIGISWSAKELEKRGAQPSSFWNALQSSSGDETYLCVYRESQWVDAAFQAPAPGRPAELVVSSRSGTRASTAEPITALHKWNHFERLWDTSSGQLLDIDLWEQTLQAFVQQVADPEVDASFHWIEDSISGVRLELEKQTIYLESANATGKRMDAPQLANLICSGANGAQFDRGFAGETNKGFLMIAEAGSGKSWMIQQVTLAICKLFENQKSDFVPLTITVQSMCQCGMKNASSDVEAFLRCLLEAEDSIMGVNLNDAIRLSLAQALRARRYI